MKSIELHTAVVDNGGTRRDAGEQITVGTKAGQIDLDRAKTMVANGSAATLRAARKPAASKPTGTKPKGATKSKAGAKPVLSNNVTDPSPPPVLAAIKSAQ